MLLSWAVCNPYAGRTPYNYSIPTYTCPCPVSTPAKGDGAATANAQALSSQPVRYADGQPLITSVDIAPTNFSIPWGQTLSYSEPEQSTNPAYSGPLLTPLGPRWTSQQMPHLLLEKNSGEEYSTGTSPAFPAS